jgi:folate-binding protein YgfZ
MTEIASLPTYGVVDLSSHTKLRLSGGDRVRYLNGQVSNDVRKATSEMAIPACVTTAKGKLNALIHIALTPEGESFLIDAAPILRESLAARLERYIIADDCELEDITEAFALLHVLGGEAWPGGIRNDHRLGGPGCDLWLPPGELPGTLERLTGAGFPLLPPDEAECLRITRAIPAWGSELTEDTLPAEALLDVHAVDFHKGCYVGQEVISRLKSVGRVNRLLVALRGEEDLVKGSVLTAPDGKEIGILTSSAGPLGLGFVKRDSAAPSTAILSRSPEKTLPTSCEILESNAL